jgi:hypothetical protein
MGLQCAGSPGRVSSRVMVQRKPEGFGSVHQEGGYCSFGASRATQEAVKHRPTLSQSRTRFVALRPINHLILQAISSPDSNRT